MKHLRFQNNIHLKKKKRFESSFVLSATSLRSPVGSRVSPLGLRRRSLKQVSSTVHSVKFNRPRELSHEIRNLLPLFTVGASVCVAVDYCMESISKHPGTPFVRGKPFFGGLPFDWADFPRAVMKYVCVFFGCASLITFKTHSSVNKIILLTFKKVFFLYLPHIFPPGESLIAKHALTSARYKASQRASVFPLIFFFWKRRIFLQRNLLELKGKRRPQVISRAVFTPAITLSSFSGYTHAHANFSPVYIKQLV